MLRKEQFLAIHGINHHVTIRYPKSCFNRIKEPRADTLFNHDPVHHHFNRVLFAFRQFWDLCHIIDLTVNSDPNIAVFLHLFNDILVLAFFLADNGS